MSTNADTDPKQQYAQLSRAMKFGFFTILIGVSLFNIFGTIFLSPQFEQIFHDMLGSKPLPGLTTFVVGHHMDLIALSITLPVAGLFACRLASPQKAVIALGVLVFAVFAQMAMTAFALILPLISIIQTMSGGSGG